MDTLTAPDSLLTTTREDLRNVRESRRVNSSDFELRDVANGTGGSELHYTGYATVTNLDYRMEDMLGPWTERILAGAFKRTLAENPDVNFLINHEGMALARTKPGTLVLVEDGTGLYAEARLDPMNPQVIALRSAIERGDIDEMSFAFRVTAQEWNSDYTDRAITEVNLHHGDVSAVNYGANPHTAGLVSLRNEGGRQASPEQLLEALDGLISRGELDEATLLALDERFALIRSLAPVATEPVRNDLEIARRRLQLVIAG